ncbi:MAG: transketolase family protein, partial [Dermatophilaceae bacterium]
DGGGDVTGPREQFALTAAELVDDDSRVALIYAEISGQYLGEVRRRHPHRVVNVGIREQLLVSAGAGMALAGLRPIVHTFASFLVERAFEQVKLDFVHQDVGGVLVGSGGSFDVAAGGRTHQSPGDVALLDTLGVPIHAPSTPREVDATLRAAVDAGGLHYIRVVEQVNGMSFAPGTHVVRRGNGPVVVVLGALLDATLAATEGLDATVLYTSTVRPFDSRLLRSVLARPEVVLVEPWLAGTSAHVVTSALHDVPHRLLALGVGRDELRRYGSPADHVAAHGLDAAGLRTSITRFLDSAPSP